MEEIQSLIEKARSDIQEGRPEEEIVQSLLPVLESEPEEAGRMIESLIENPHPRIARILQHLLKISGDKKIRKTIKRSLYRLKSRGIPVEEISPEKEGPVFRPLQAEPPGGFGGPFDFLGQRFLMLIVPHTGRGLTVMQGIVSDTEGLADFSGGEMPRKRFRGFFEEVQKGSPFPLAEMEPSYVGFLFVQAYKRTLERGKTPPQDYLHLKGEVDGVKREYKRALIYSHIREDEIEGDDLILRRGGDLLKTDVFTTWKMREEEIRPYADEVWAAEESKLVLNQPQKEARFQEIYQKALSNLFPEERRSLYMKRMEEMAYILLKWGREEEARIALAVALDLKKPAHLLQPNPFLFQLVVRTIFTLLSEAYEKKVKEPSFIVKP
ncbi:MAG: hypothetical protein A2V86_04650 [Deltaproteobacteria bacterium RBG_16_49_23]|nr:MAG: hypothetical protein A2V86_04650 [Deltaproteobacteria bacterium RBG_16_49_23]